MKPEELDELLHIGERRNVEFKAPGTLKKYKDKIVKAAIALANLRDGGVLVIGVTDDLQVVGLSAEELASYEGDAVIEHVNKYADPYVDLEVTQIQHPAGDCICIRVNEFNTVPVICKKGSEKLNHGALYIRSGRKPSSEQVSSHTDMRELINLATQKEVRRIQSFFQPDQASKILSDRQQFEEQTRFSEESSSEGLVHKPGNQRGCG